MPPDARYLTPRDIELTGLADADTVRTWIATGQLKAVNAGKHPRGGKPRWKILQSDLEAFLAARSNGPARSQAVHPEAES